MAKLKTEAITKQDILACLDVSDDFAFEMQVVEKTSVGDFKTSHGGTYDAPVTGLPREFDIRTRRHVQHDPNNQGIRNTEVVFLAVESKNLKEYNPLVVSRVPRRKEEAYFVRACSHGQSRILKSEVRRGDLYCEGEMVGKSTAQIGKRSQDVWSTDDGELYKKWAQAVSSSRDLIWSTKKFPNLGLKHNVNSITLPVVVVPDETL